MGARWRALGLRTRLLIYIEHHREAFGGAPSGPNLAAAARLISVKTDFRALHSWTTEPFDACVCRCCFFELWGRAVRMEQDHWAALRLDLEQASAPGQSLPGFEPPGGNSVRKVPCCRGLPDSCWSMSGTLRPFA
jgi:hypothetical protein